MLGLGLIRIGGPDAQKFLQSQLTCDITQINSQKSNLGGYCTHKGKVLALFRIFYFQNDYYLALPNALLEKALTHLKKYGVFSKITLEDVSQTWACLGILWNTQTNKINETFSQEKLVFICVEEKNHRYELFGPKDLLTSFTQHPSSDKQIIESSQWRLFNIQAQIPSIFPETSELFTPHMLNLPELGAVSFSKGCYLGQEIVARTEHLGKTKRNLKNFIFPSPTPLSPGETLYQEGKEIGVIVDAISTDPQQYEVLAVVSATTI